MKKNNLSLIVLSLAGILTISVIMIHCAALAPSKIQIQTTMKPVVKEGDDFFSVQEDGALVYAEKGMKVIVKPMNDEQLDKMFPDISNKKEASTNPYTYGNLLDPELGYTPTRFTVFVVKIFNYTKPKINFDPRIAVLKSDRGDLLNSYVRDQKADADRELRSVENVGHALNFESYYMRARGSSGVERQRFEKRMGIIRQTLYVGGQVFKGDKKEGMLVFDPLESDEKKIELVLKDFVFEYDANKWPSIKKDIVFSFTREIKKREF